MRTLREAARKYVDDALAGWQVLLVEVQQAPEDSLLSDFLYDSLDSVEAIMKLEDDLMVEIDDDVASQWKTIADVVNFILEKKFAQAPGFAQST